MLSLYNIILLHSSSTKGVMEEHHGSPSVFIFSFVGSLKVNVKYNKPFVRSVLMPITLNVQVSRSSMVMRSGVKELHDDAFRCQGAPW